MIGFDDEALSALEHALDPDKPDVRVLDLLAELQMKAGKLDEAEKLYEMGRKDDPQNSKTPKPQNPVRVKILFIYF